MRLSRKSYYKSGQWSADFITVVRVHNPSSCHTDYTFCFSYRNKRPKILALNAWNMSNFGP